MLMQCNLIEIPIHLMSSICFFVCMQEFFGMQCIWLRALIVVNVSIVIAIWLHVMFLLLQWNYSCCNILFQKLLLFSNMCYELFLLLPLWFFFYYHNLIIVASKCKNDMKLYIWCVFFTYDVLMWSTYDLHFN
jgi:hypothetical protein